MVTRGPPAPPRLLPRETLGVPRVLAGTCEPSVDVRRRWHLARWMEIKQRRGAPRERVGGGGSALAGRGRRMCVSRSRHLEDVCLEVACPRVGRAPPPGDVVKNRARFVALHPLVR